MYSGVRRRFRADKRFQKRVDGGVCEVVEIVENEEEGVGVFQQFDQLPRHGRGVREAGAADLLRAFHALMGETREQRIPPLANAGDFLRDGMENMPALFAVRKFQVGQFVRHNGFAVAGGSGYDGEDTRRDGTVERPENFLARAFPPVFVLHSPFPHPATDNENAFSCIALPFLRQVVKSLHAACNILDFSGL